MDNSFDIVVIGSGPGGYVAAIRAAQLGYNAALVEKYDVLGGTCTIVGCIPSKALLDASENFHAISHKFAGQGINIPEATLDFPAFMARKNQVVKQNSDGLSYLMRKNKITTFFGKASFITDRQISIDDKVVIDATYFVIATGSKPATIPGVQIDKDRIITSTEALSLNEKPESIVIIGGGVIGAELASIYNRIGTHVTILEYSSSLIPRMDRELGIELGKMLKKSGVAIEFDRHVKKVINNGNSATVQYLDPNGIPQEVTADYCIVAVGRRPYTDGLGLENIEVSLDESGYIVVDKTLRTETENIYAIGDVISGPMLAHKAEHEAVYVIETIHGISGHLRYRHMPSIIYTWPEIASAGYSEDELQMRGIKYRKGTFPFMASGRARAAGDISGFAKVLASEQQGEILGVHIVGARAADLIQSAVVAMELGTTDIAMAKMWYAHPTYAEILKDAFLISSGKGPINI